MNRARTLVATAVVAACSAWPLATMAQSGGSGSGSGASGAGSSDGTTRYDAPPPAQRPADSAPNPLNQPSGTAGTTGSTTDSTNSTSGTTSPSTPAPRGRTDGGSAYNTLGLGGSTTSMTDAEWEQGRGSSYSLLPMTSYGYVGLNVGWTDWKTPCAGTFACDNDFGGKIYTGGLISRMVGVEVGYLNFGSPLRSGGEWRAQGINASIVANLPVDPVNVFARFGTTYGWTKAFSAPGTGIRSGEDDGFGLAYGAGVGFDVTPKMQVTAEWDRNEFRFVTGREDIDMYSVGVRYKF